MNKERREDLSIAETYMENARDIVSRVLNDEQRAYDNLPYGLQCSSNGEKMNDAISMMYDAVSDIESSIDDIRDAMV